jgi:hypothetical protein
MAITSKLESKLANFVNFFANGFTFFLNATDLTSFLFVRKNKNRYFKIKLFSYPSKT